MIQVLREKRIFLDLKTYINALKEILSLPRKENQLLKNEAVYKISLKKLHLYIIIHQHTICSTSLKLPYLN